jgi:hypothetical protein
MSCSENEIKLHLATPSVGFVGTELFRSHKRVRLTFLPGPRAGSSGLWQARTGRSIPLERTSAEIDTYFWSPVQGPAPAAADYSVRGGGQMTSQVAAALAAARSADRSQHAGTAALGAMGTARSAGDASVRFGAAHVASSSDGFAAQFGPYAGARRNPTPFGIPWPGADGQLVQT